MEIQSALKRALRNGHSVGDEYEKSAHHITIRLCKNDGCQAAIIRDTTNAQIAGSALTHVCKNWRLPDQNDPALKGMTMKDKHRSVYAENKLKLAAEEAAAAAAN